MRDKVKFGRIEVVIHAGQPQKIIMSEKDIMIEGKRVDK